MVHVGNRDLLADLILKLSELIWDQASKSSKENYILSQVGLRCQSVKLLHVILPYYFSTENQVKYVLNKMLEVRIEIDMFVNENWVF